MFASIVQINPITTISRKRILPFPGKLFVRKGQKVCASDVIAEAEMNSEYYMLDISQGLGLPVEIAEQYIQCKVGVDVDPGDLLAGPVGLTKRVVRTPYSGKIIFIRDGKVFLRLQGRTHQLKAGINGTVTELIDERGVWITTTGAIIQGVWGNQEIDVGILTVLNNQPGSSLFAEQLDMSMRGSIVYGGHCSQENVLQTAVDLSLRGLIFSSINSKLLDYARSIKIPVIVLEGFGQIPINMTSYEILSANENREVVINAEPYDRFSGKRPEIIIPLPTPTGFTPQSKHDLIDVGQSVRIIRAPYAGRIGKINSIYSEMFSFKNGIRIAACEIRLENGETVPVPITNLEIIH